MSRHHPQPRAAGRRKSRRWRIFFRERRSGFDRRSRAVDLPSSSARYVYATQPLPAAPAPYLETTMKNIFAPAAEIVLAALLLAAAVYLALLTPGIRIAPFDLPGEMSVLQWPRQMLALACGFFGLRFAFGSWGGYPELRPALVGVIVLVQAPVWWTVGEEAAKAIEKAWMWL